MNHYVKIAIVLCACFAVTAAQYQPFGFDYTDYATNFAGPSYNSFAAAAAAPRDPRENPGPVLFPSSPRSDPSQTSGVVVGASGFGFVPTGSQGPAIPRFYYRSFYLR